MLHTVVSYQFKYTVWRLEIDSLNETIFTEIRNQADKKVSFASISLKNGAVNFDDLQTEERWLTGIESAYDGVLLVHNYQSESGPTHKGLIAIDALTGQILWSDFNLSFDHLTINGPAIYDTRFQPRKLFVADIKTGIQQRKYEPVIDLELSNDLLFPQQISAELALSLHLPVHPLENTVYYVEHNNFRIVSLHAITEGALQQHLYIIQDTEMVYEDLLNTDIQKLQPESFLIYKDQLIYLKNQSQLKVLNL